ncbi:hypothetical protein HYV89_00175 [Candidatus Woesearchaeota archaeon]|nr:hypothetical protein [Candidatus Woesearchaeota archaeon]
MQQSKLEIEKNIKDLEHRKLISDYNASLAAIISATIGITGISYQVFKNWIISLFIGAFVFLMINMIRKNINRKLKEKIIEIKNLANDKDSQFA